MEDRHKKIYRAGLLGIFLNVGLVIAKGVVGLASGSVAVLTDAVNNLTDTLSAIVTLVGTKLAQKKPDREHPHGHGRIEYLTAMVVGVIIVAVGIGAIMENAPKIMEPELAQYSVWSIVVIFTTVIAKIIYSRYAQKIGEETRSRSLRATGTDAMYDAALSTGTLVGAGVSLAFGISIDGWIGVIIAAMIIRSGIEIIQEGMSEVIGRRVDEGLARKIRGRIREFPEVKEVKNLTLHDYGPTKMSGAVKIEVSGKMKMEEFEKLAEEIEQTIKDEFGIKLTIGVC